jgi:phage N-6-adenine-methyltransferase
LNDRLGRVDERMNVNPGMYSSKTELWGTPQKTFDELNAEFQFTLDVCAIPENAKCPHYFTPEVDGLVQDWNGHTCWMNPPYGRRIGKWVEKAHAESRKGVTVVALLPARTDTIWFHDHIHGTAEIRFLRGRLYFNDADGRAPFPSMVVVWKSAA